MARKSPWQLCYCLTVWLAAWSFPVASTSGQDTTATNPQADSPGVVRINNRTATRQSQSTTKPKKPGLMRRLFGSTTDSRRLLSLSRADLPSSQAAHIPVYSGQQQIVRTDGTAAGNGQVPYCPPAAAVQPECEEDDSTFCWKLGDPWTLSSLLGEEPPVTIGGWWQAGYTNKSNGVFNTHPDRLNLHQGWLYVERVADGSKGFDFGGRADLIYGVDAQNTQAFGGPPGTWDFMNGWDNGIYGSALPQLYGEIAYGDLSVKIGKFYTLLGYEVVTAPDNFFFSHAFTMNFSEAFTHTGALATYKVNEQVTGYAGWTAGWDTGFTNLNGGSNFLGGASVKMFDDALTLTWILTAGNLGAIGDGYTHSIVADWTINDKWNYVIQSDVVETTSDFDSFGINQYLFYTICDNWKAGARLEWWKADGTSYYEVTGGVNFKPMANLTIRPEVRYQWAPGGAGNAFGIPSNTGIFGVDAILTY